MEGWRRERIVAYFVGQTEWRGPIDQCCHGDPHIFCCFLVCPKHCSRELEQGPLASPRIPSLFSPPVIIYTLFSFSLVFPIHLFLHTQHFSSISHPFQDSTTYIKLCLCFPCQNRETKYSHSCPKTSRKVA